MGLNLNLSCSSAKLLSHVNTSTFREGEVCEFSWYRDPPTLYCTTISTHPRFNGLPDHIDGVVIARKSTLIAFSGDRYYLIKNNGVVKTSGHPLPFDSSIYLAFDSFYPGYAYISLRSDPDNYILLKTGVLSNGKRGCPTATCSKGAIWEGWSYRSMVQDWALTAEDFKFCEEF